MSPQETSYDTEDRTVDAVEYTGGSRHRHQTHTANATSRGLRVAYFSAASAWGFVAGVAGLLIFFQMQGRAIPTGPATWLFLAPGLAVAIGGGVVIAGAYQEAKRRRR